MDFYLRFLYTIPNPVQLFLNLVKTGFIGGIPVDKLPRRLYNGTGEFGKDICYVTDIPDLNCLKTKGRDVLNLFTENLRDKYFVFHPVTELSLILPSI